MERQPCTCSSKYELCASCKDYEEKHRNGRDDPIVMIYGKKRRSKYTVDQIVTAKAMWKEGCTYESIAERINISFGSVRYILAIKILEQPVHKE